MITELFCIVSYVSAAWVGHTDKSRAYAERFVFALADAGLSEKAAAEIMGLTPQELSRQLAGVHPLSAYRVRELPQAFHEAMAKRDAAAFGWEILTPTQVEIFKGAAVLGRKVMARMFVHPSAERKQA